MASRGPQIRLHSCEDREPGSPPGSPPRSPRHRRSSLTPNSPTGLLPHGSSSGRRKSISDPSSPRRGSVSSPSSSPRRGSVSSPHGFQTEREREQNWSGHNQVQPERHITRVEKIARRLKGEMALFRAMAIVDKLEEEETLLEYLRTHPPRPARGERRPSVGFSEEVEQGRASPSFVETLSVEAQIAVLMEYKELLDKMLHDGRVTLDDREEADEFLADNDWSCTGEERYEKLCHQYDHVWELMDEVKRCLGQKTSRNRGRRRSVY